MHRRSRVSFPGLASLAVFTVLAIAALSPAAYAQNTVGTVTKIQGIANVTRGGATLAVIPHLPIMLHDRIVTEQGASMMIGLVDNSSLQLGGGATLTIDESVLVNGVGAPSKVGLLGGSVHALIAGAMKGSTTTFQIQTPNAVGAVRGTEWDTDYSDGVARDQYPDCLQFTDVEVEDGTVNVSIPQDPNSNEDVHAGHKTTVACGAIVAASGSAGIAALGGISATTAAIAGGAVAAGTGVGIAAGVGGFGNNNNGKKKKKTPKD